MAETTMWLPLRWFASAKPLMARLDDSVPPEVKMRSSSLSALIIARDLLRALP